MLELVLIYFRRNATAYCQGNELVHIPLGMIVAAEKPSAPPMVFERGLRMPTEMWTRHDHP